MTSSGGAGAEAVAGLPHRVAALVELLTTLDLRVRAALEGLEDMRRSVAPLETIGDSGNELVADIRHRADALDERLNRDLDELKNAIMSKLDELDLAGFGPRFDRLEAAVYNIEKATVHLDEAFQGALEMLPDFMTKRLKQEGRMAAPQATDD